MPDRGRDDDALPLNAPRLDRIVLEDPVLISDLHLAGAVDSRTAAFARFCADVAPGYRELLILGDLFEYWAGDDDADGEVGRRVAQLLSGLADRGLRIFLMQGNRDLLLGARYAAACGGQLLVDPTRATRAATASAPPVLLAHGDRYCTLDAAYQQFRSQVRDAAWQKQFLAQPLAARHALIGSVRARSESDKRDKAMTIMDVTPEAVAEELTAAGATTMIHGHTHRPGHYTIHAAGARLERWVLPDWDQNGTPGRGGYLDWRSDPWVLHPVD